MPDENIFPRGDNTEPGCCVCGSERSLSCVWIEKWPGFALVVARLNVVLNPVWFLENPDDRYRESFARRSWIKSGNIQNDAMKILKPFLPPRHVLSPRKTKFKFT